MTHNLEVIDTREYHVVFDAARPWAVAEFDIENGHIRHIVGRFTSRRMANNCKRERDAR